MSWSNDKSEIKSVLSGYREIPNNYDIDERPQSSNHKAYILRPIGVDSEELTSGAILTSTFVRLEVIYNNSKDRDGNYDLFTSLYDSIKSLNKFAGFESYEYEKLDTKHSRGILEFYYGFRSC